LLDADAIGGGEAVALGATHDPRIMAAAKNALSFTGGKLAPRRIAGSDRCDDDKRCHPEGFGILTLVFDRDEVERRA